VHQPTSYTCIGWIINSLLSAFVHHTIYIWRFSFFVQMKRMVGLFGNMSVVNISR
jgi:hypothetical protein